MKIGIVHTSYLQKGGEDIAIRQECELLAESGCVVSQLRSYHPARGYRQFITFLLSLGNPLSRKRMGLWLDDEAPDLVHIHDWHFSASPNVIRAAKRKGIPVVLTLHDFRLLSPSLALLNGLRLFRASVRGRFPWKAVFKRVYNGSFIQTFWLSSTLWLHRAYGTWKGVDRYIVLTPGARDIFLSAGVGFDPARLLVKPNCLPDTGRQVVERQKHFLYIGRLSGEHGLPTLLKAFALSPYRLTILGEGPLSPSVDEYAEHFGNIEYKGQADTASIPDECARCTALIFPSMWYEGSPTAIIEALACGTPVIASRTGVIKDMIIDGVNGLHFEPGDAHDLCRKLEQWQDLDAEKRQEYGERARESYILHYTPEKNISDLLAIYRSVLEDHREAAGGSPDESFVKPENVIPSPVAKPEMQSL